MVLLKNFVALMLLHPEVQTRAQEEIDALLNGSRLPGLNEYVQLHLVRRKPGDQVLYLVFSKDSLPYVDALVQEVHRWEPISPLSVPHRVMEDDNYKGMFIPKGTTILSNLW